MRRSTPPEFRCGTPTRCAPSLLGERIAPVDLRDLSVSLKACSATTTAVELDGANGQTAPDSGEPLADGAGHETADGDILRQPAGHRGAQRGVSGTRVAVKAPERTAPVM